MDPATPYEFEFIVDRIYLYYDEDDFDCPYLSIKKGDTIKLNDCVFSAAICDLVDIKHEFVVTKIKKNSTSGILHLEVEDPYFTVYGHTPIQSEAGRE